MNHVKTSCGFLKVLRPSDRARLIVVLWFRSLCYAKLTGCRLYINIDVTSRQQINKTENSDLVQHVHKFPSFPGSFPTSCTTFNVLFTFTFLSYFRIIRTARSFQQVQTKWASSEDQEDCRCIRSGSGPTEPAATDSYSYSEEVVDTHQMSLDRLLL